MKKGYVIGGLLALWLLLNSNKTAALNKYFSLDDVTASDKANQLNIGQQFNPPVAVIRNASRLAKHLINPILDWIIDQNNNAVEVGYSASSWYRCDELNAAVGGSSTSDHLEGNAVDLNVFIAGEKRNDIIVRAVLAQNLPFDQLIIELGTYDRPGWIHLSYKPGNNDHQILRYDGNSYVNVSREWAEDYYL